MDLLELLGGFFRALWAAISFVADWEILFDPIFWLLIPAILWAGGALALALAAGASTGVAAAIAFAAFVAALIVTFLWDRSTKEYGYILWGGALIGTVVIVGACWRAAVAAQPAN